MTDSAEAYPKSVNTNSSPSTLKITDLRVATVVKRLDGVGAVLDDSQVVGLGQLAQLVHLARTAGKVNWNQRPGPRRKSTLDVGRIQAHRRAVDVG